MNSILEILKSKNVIMSILAILLIAVLFYVSTIFRISWMMRIGILVFILLIAVIILLIKKMSDIKKSGQIEQSIDTQADDQIKSLSPEKRAEIEQFKKQLEAAITSLKNSKIGKGKSGKAALYALPWYMIIGPSAAGKTTAIQNSGLDFPFGKDGFRGVGGTRNCDWFFSTKAIFLDTAGRYINQSEDRIEWISFLDVLKKNRKKKPINGVLVAINIDEIIKCEKDELYEHAKNIRQRIDELIENLGVNFPVYFIFTKCDLIQGFVDYYSDFSEIERSQIWGATFSNQQHLNGEPKNIFEEEFNILVNKLFEIRTIRLSSPLKREQRRNVFLFPFQFKSLQKKLTYLIGEVFQPNPYQDNPLFRGFYFTSGTQEGVPLDLAIREIAKQFNLPGVTNEEENASVETKNYFIKDLLNDIVIADQNYSVGVTASSAKNLNKTKLITIGTSFAFLILFSLFAIFGYNGNNQTLDKISQHSSAFANINWSGNLLTNFREADNLRQLIEKITDDDASEAFISFGMDRSERTLDPLKRLYLSKTESFFTKNVYGEIEKVLNKYANGQDFSGEQIYNYLKSYLLLGNERARIDTSEKKFLVHVFTGILESRYIDSNPVASASEKDSLKILFRNYLSFFVDNLGDKNVYPVHNDNLLVNLVRDRIQFKPNAESLYARLKQNGLSQFPQEITLEQLIGGIYATLIKTGSKIPFIFSDEGWKNYFRQAILEESANPEKEDWVLGKKHIKSANINFNSQDMKRDLLVLYLNDYKQNWLQFLQNIRYSNFDNVPLAANNLKQLSDPVNSPLILILKKFADQMQTIINIQSPDSNNSDPSFAGLNLNSSNLIEIKKYEKFVIGSPDGGAGADLNAIVAQYGILNGVLESIKDGQDLTKDYAVKVLSQRAVEFPTSLQVIRGAVYNIQALQNLFIEPVKLSWRAITSDAVSYLNVQWKAKVVDAFNKSIANSFPFKNSSSDVPIQDFKDFFKPQDGILWTFFNNELSAFINKDRWKANQWENEGINISTQFLSSLKKANDISNILFKNGNLGVSFKLKPQLPQSKPIQGKKPIVEQIYLYLDGEENYYKMGAPYWIDFNWPGIKGTPGARMNISMSDYGTSDTKYFEGDWALFRLLDDASASHGQSSSQYIFSWFFKKENLYDIVVSYNLDAGSSHNPFSSRFF